MEGVGISAYWFYNCERRCNDLTRTMNMSTRMETNLRRINTHLHTCEKLLRRINTLLHTCEKPWKDHVQSREMPESLALPENLAHPLHIRTSPINRTRNQIWWSTYNFSNISHFVIALKMTIVAVLTINRAWKWPDFLKWLEWTTEPGMIQKTYH